MKTLIGKELKQTQKVHVLHTNIYNSFKIFKHLPFILSKPLQSLENINTTVQISKAKRDTVLRFNIFG